MIYFNKLTIAASVVALSLPSALGASIYTISDDRIRSLDISPVLGRGYSIMTNSFQSTCLMATETTTPSYNYDYYYTDFTQSEDDESAFQGKLSTSFAIGSVQLATSVEAKSTSKVSKQTHNVVSTMRIERYYSSVREEISPLSPDAAQLLDSEDYVGFFKACGPNYVRGIRRAQEVTTIFTFQSSSRERAKDFAMSMKASYGWSGAKSSVMGKSKFKSTNSSLQIKILGFGLGLSQEGSETMVATSYEEVQAVMKFAFNSMTRAEDAARIGMVYGMEVVPWVHNSAFQVAAKLQDQNLAIPMPRSLIPKAIYSQDSSNYGVTPPKQWVESNRAEFACKGGLNFYIDKFGYCCEGEQMFVPTTKLYRSAINQNWPPQITDVCKPLRVLDRSLIKDNMSNNGEFVARMDNALRYRMNAMGTMEKCISAVNSVPEKFYHNILKKQDSVKYDKVIEADYSFLHLKLAVDPMADYRLLKQIGYELDEWVDQFYSPCLAALFGMNIGTSPDTDVSYFMAYPWFSHDECMKLTCLTPGLRWDRDNGGCIPGVLSGSTAPYSGDKCMKDPDDFGDNEDCKYTATKMNQFMTDVADKTCWEPITSAGAVINISYFMDHYCMPDFTTKISEWTASKTSLIESYNRCQDTGMPNNEADYNTWYENKYNHSASRRRRRRLGLSEKNETVDIPASTPLKKDDLSTLTMGLGGGSSGNDEFVMNLKRRIALSKNGADGMM